MAEQRLEEIKKIRTEKAKKLLEMGVNPYPSTLAKTPVSVEKAKDAMGKSAAVAGRIMGYREHGNIIFADIKDETGNIQLFFQKKVLGEDFKIARLIDMGDFVLAWGKVFKTEAGEITIDVEGLQMLTKSIRPLPSSWHGLKDIEERYRRRYVDLILRPEVKDMFVRKSKFWQANREFMQQNGFIEVETPVLEHFTGGADAKPFKTHHEALDEDFYLRISTELYQKRLMVGGFEKIYTLGPNFRNEGIDDEHLQEYYQIEWYWGYANYEMMMDMVRESFIYVAKKVYGKTKFTKGKHTFDLGGKWEMIDYTDVIKTKLGVDIFKDSDEHMLSVLKEHGVKLPGAINRARLVDNLWKLIRKNISGPAFLINEPKFVSPLAKSKPENPELTERFHVIIAGTELGNGYSELNDPVDQLERFEEQQKARDAGDDEAQMLDHDYVEALEFGMPPTAGYAHSERVFWFLEDVTAREGTFFPQMKRKSS